MGGPANRQRLVIEAVAVRQRYGVCFGMEDGRAAPEACLRPFYGAYIDVIIGAKGQAGQAVGIGRGAGNGRCRVIVGHLVGIVGDENIPCGFPSTGRPADGGTCGGDAACLYCCRLQYIDEPVGGVGAVACGALGDGHRLGGLGEAGTRPTHEGVFPFRGVDKGEGGCLDVVGGGVGCRHGAAVEFVGDAIFSSNRSVDGHVLIGHGQLTVGGGQVAGSGLEGACRSSIAAKDRAVIRIQCQDHRVSVA